MCTAAVCYPAVCSVCSWCNCSSVLRLVSSGTGLAAKHQTPAAVLYVCYVMSCYSSGNLAQWLQVVSACTA